MSPPWLPLLWLVILPGAVLMIRAERRGQIRLAPWQPLPGGRRRRIDDLTALLCALLVLAALQLPSFSPRQPEASSAPTLVLAVDVSPSMSAGDVAPTRLDRVKAEIRQLVAALPGATFALLPFAGEAVEQLPLTADHEALLFFVDQLSPGMVAAPGSAPAAAARRAQQLLGGSAAPSGVILFSDGERTLPGPSPEVLTTVPIYVVPVGSPAGAPFLDREGRPQLDNTRQPQLSRAQPERLTALAERSGGALYPLQANAPALAALAAQWQTPATAPAASPTLLLWLALGCWLLRYLPAGRRNATQTVTTVLLLMLVMACDRRDPARAQLETAYRAFQTGDLAAAAQHYAQAADALDGAQRAAARRDQGTVLLLHKERAAAMEVLTAALLENPFDEATRTNLAVTLRQGGDDAAGATGSGPGDEPERDGVGLSRQQALKLLENVIPRTVPDAPLRDAKLREVPVARDW